MVTYIAVSGFRTSPLRLTGGSINVTVSDMQTKSFPYLFDHYPTELGL